MKFNMRTKKYMLIAYIINIRKNIKLKKEKKTIISICTRNRRI